MRESASVQELIQAGIDAAKAGNTARATALFAQAVKLDPRSEMAWLHLGHMLASPEEREFCFRRVLAINPLNVDAKQQLAALKPPAPEPEKPPAAPAAAPTPGRIEAARTPSLTAEPPAPQAGPAARPAARPKRKRRSAWGWIAAGTVMVLFCLGAAGAALWARQNLFVPVPPLPTPALPTLAGEGGTASPAPGLPAQSYTAVFERGNCAVTLPEGANADCGFVTVPEDRRGDLTHTIRLAIIRYRSRAATPGPDPIIYLAGGPGQKALDWSLGAYSTVIYPFLEKRDFIVLDPRGTGYSQPRLACEGLMRTYYQDLEGKIPADQRAFYYEGAIMTCQQDVAQAGANPAAYTSTDMADDVRDVILALGYQQANLYGISYGTRVAQVVMRDHPEVVRAAVLDSVVPVETQLLNQSPEEKDYALQVLFESCQAEAACKAAYPDLASDYKQAMQQLDKQPAQVPVRLATQEPLTEKVDGAAFEEAVRWALREPEIIPLVPRLIHQVATGDASMLSSVLQIPLQVYNTMDKGAFVAVSCHDQASAATAGGLDAAISDLCKLWNTRPLEPGENDPVHSDIPALLLAGKYDPVTPVPFAQQVAANLAQGHLVIIPNQGHAASSTGFSDCLIQLMQAFLDSPGQAPDETCVQRTPPVAFVAPVKADTPLPLQAFTDENMKLSTQVPEKWAATGNNFFSRNGFALDVTQVGVQAATVDEGTWIQWLQSNFSGDTGLDYPPLKSDTLKANDLNWTLYRSRYLGHPVDLAFAKSGDQTLMVVLVSFTDERDALYQAVFLPVVKATGPLQ